MKSLLKRFWKKEEGVAIIEFALVAPVFFFLVFAGLEYGIINFVSSTLNTVVNEAGRLGMTGNNYTDMQAPDQPPISREEFITLFINDKMGPLAGMGDITITPVPYSDLSGMNAGGGTDTGYGSGGQIVIYEVTYRWKVFTPLMGSVIGDANGDYVIRARTVIQNEAFS